MIVTLGLKGDAELLAAFRELDEATRGDTLAAAATAGMLPIRNAQEGKAPKRTRTLGRSVHIEIVEKTASTAVARSGTDLDYAAMQEFGGTVHAQSGKYLAIPLTKGGRAKGPREYGHKLHFVPLADGGLLVDSQARPIYKLQPAVTIPAHPYMRPGFDEQKETAVAEVEKVLGAAIDRVAKATK